MEFSTVYAAAVNLRCYQGDTYNPTLEFKKKSDNTPYDLTGYTFKMEVRTKDNSRLLILSFESGAGIEMTDTNEIQLLKSAEEMLIEPGTYLYDLKATYPDNTTTKTWFYGNFVVQQKITV